MPVDFDFDISDALKDKMSDYSKFSESVGTGISQDIIGILKDYKKPLPIDFLAYVLKRSTADLEPDLELLKNKRLLYIEGENVKLVKP